MSVVPARLQLIVIVATFLVSAACGSLGEPYLGSFPTSSLPAPNDESVVGSDEGPSDPSLDALVLALPPRPADYLPSLIVVSSDGVFAVDRAQGDPSAIGLPRALDLRDAEERSAPTTTSTTSSTTTSTTTAAATSTPDTTTTVVEVTGPAYAVAKDDLFGGIVAQTTDGSVVWFPGTGGGPRVVETEDGRLFDVGYVAGTPEAITERAGQVTRTRLVDNEALVLTGLAAGAEMVDLSSAGGVVALATSDTECGDVRFLSGEGEELAIDPFDDLTCDRAARPTIGSVGMSPDGEALAYTIVTYREDGVEQSTTLRAVELTSGAEIIDAEVGGSGEAVSSLAFDGVSAVMVRRSSARSDVIQVDAIGIGVIELPGIANPRGVTFARLPLSEELYL